MYLVKNFCVARLLRANDQSKHTNQNDFSYKLFWLVCGPDCYIASHCRLGSFVVKHAIIEQFVLNDV